MEWEILYHNAFAEWLTDQEERVQDAILVSLELLEAEGPMLPRPHVDTLKGSRYPNLKELRVQCRGEPWRILFAFDPKRRAIILLSGNKAGKPRWYEENMPIAERRFEEHLRTLNKRG